ncbi:MAG: ABC transporter transmembrane domain-containing protein, partial [Pirellulaceae bacterium]|nr:ABC transporter transmembrane domain-containing protein [Pirellulaceae bacterium]
MKNFLRAVRLALRYRWTVVGAILCSLGIALLWSANIGTVYPIIEVVFQDKSVPQWADEEVQKLQDATRISRQEISQQQDLLKGTGTTTAAEREKQQHQLSLTQAKLVSEEEALGWALWMQPYAQRYLPGTPFLTLVVVVVLLITGTLIKDLFLVANMILIERLSQRATFDLRRQFYRNTLRMDLGTFGDNHTAGLMARFTNDMGALTRGISTLLGKTVREPLKMTVCLVGACMICWRLLLLSMVIAPLAIYLVSRLASSIKRASRRALEEMTHLYGVLSETFSGIQVVKAFTTEQAEQQRFDETARNYYRRSMRIVKYNSLIRPTTELMGISIICLAMLAGGYLVLNQQTHLLGLRMSARPLGFGALITFYALLIGSSDP